GTLPQRVELVPTGVLSPTLPVGFQPLVEQVLSDKPLAQRLGALRGALTGARDMAVALSNHVRQMFQPSEPQPTWPLGTVRVRFPAPWYLGDVPASVSFPEEPSLQETFDRWARAATGRRVGLALGGGGAFGYVHLALLERLLEPSRTRLAPSTSEEESSLRVPVDMISGSSFGTVVGAFYCVGGKKGLERMKEQWGLLAGAIPFGVVTSTGIQWILDSLLGPVKLEQLEVPLFPVVVDADAGVEWDVRQGTVGQGVRASGAFPPLMGPLILRNRRLLDGGFVANVPVNVLRTEGANLLIASNPIPRLSPRSRTYPRIPVVSSLWRQVNPRLRVEDSYRMLTLIGRVAGESQSRSQDMVVYRPKFNSASITAMNRGFRVSAEAEESLELGQAVLAARALWRSRLNNAVSLIRWDEQASTAQLTEPVLFDGELISPVSQRSVLAELVDFLQHRKGFSSFLLEATAATEAEALARAQALKQYLIESFVPHPPEKIEARGEASKETPESSCRVRLQLKSGRVDAQYAARMEEAWREQQEVARRALADAQARRLHLAVERQGRTGDPERVRLLALEAARLDRSADTDRALRTVLDRRGTLLRRFDAEIPVTCLAWSPDGRRLAVGYNDGTLRLWDVEQGQHVWAGRQPNGRDVAINIVAWSPSGHLLASSGCDSQLVLWGHIPEGLVPVAIQFVNTWNHCALAFSPTGGHLLGPLSTDDIGKRGAAILRVRPDGQLDELSEQDLLPGAFAAAAWDPEPRSLRFATVGDDKLTLWRMAQAGPEQLREVPLEGASTLAWTRAGAALVVGGARGAFILRPDEGAEPLLLDTQGQTVQKVAWSTDGKRVLATLLGGNALHVWEPSGKLLTVLRMEAEGLLQSVLCHPERPEVALTWGGEAACVWDVSTCRQLAWLGGHTGLIQQAAWSADGNRVATVSADGSVRVWGPFGGGPKRSSWSEFEEQGLQAAAGKRFRWPSSGVGFHLQVGDGRRIWVTSRGEAGELLVPVQSRKNGRLAPKPWRRGTPLPREVFSREGNPPYMHWSPDRSKVALQESGRVSIWDAKAWELLGEHAREGLNATHVAWHPSGKRLAISRFTGWHQAVMLWELEQSPQPVLLKGAAETDGVWELAWSPHGEQLVTASNDGHVCIYSVSHEEARAKVVMHLHHWAVPRRVAWRPQGDLIACGDRLGAVQIWNSEGRDLVSSPQLRRALIELLVWSPDGSHLFSADMTGRALLWRRDGEAWVTMAVLDAEPSRLRWAAFSEDGTWVVTTDYDGRVRFHPVDLDTLVGCVKAHPGRQELTVLERALYQISGSV
ncbi:patatin-like phospholipase family protein, partial [Hyalangium sp.]|uniref:WD40 domain-containing protein n=1 Tax=Hyalangium sp. TaxID=2028555 RepID=UPI002D36B8E5